MPYPQKKYTKTYDLKHPFKNKWFKMRYRAQKRNIDFNLTYEEFRDWCLKPKTKRKDWTCRE